MARFNLPDIDFVNETVDDLEQLQVNKFEELMGGTISLDETDPRRAVFKTTAFLGYLILNNINFTGQQNLLSYAVDHYLDHQGIKRNVPRLEAKYATTTIRFECEAPVPFVIPAGTLMVINELFWSSSENITVDAGAQNVDIVFKCTEPGESANGYLPGQITELVEPDELPYVVSTYNTTKTAGGTEIEDDDPYAERISLAGEKFATAGPEDAYKYYAKSANQNIIDVHIENPAGSQIVVMLLMKNGEAPTDEEKNAVLEIFNDKTIRPMSDLVSASGPTFVNYSLEVSYSITADMDPSTAEVAVQLAVDEYVLWQKSKFGRGIDPSYLYALLQETGVKRIVVTPNNYTAIGEKEVAIASSTQINFGGVVDG